MRPNNKATRDLMLAGAVLLGSLAQLDDDITVAIIGGIAVALKIFTAIGYGTSLASKKWFGKLAPIVNVIFVLLLLTALILMTIRWIN